MTLRCMAGCTLRLAQATFLKPPGILTALAGLMQLILQCPGPLSLIAQSATCLANLLLSKCDNEGGVGERVDIHWQLGRMTLQVGGLFNLGGVRMIREWGQLGMHSR